jgi:hypothetical protein
MIHKDGCLCAQRLGGGTDIARMYGPLVNGMGTKVE